MRFIRVDYMCPKCNRIYFFYKSEEYSTKCETCNVEMSCVGEKYTSTEEEDRMANLRNVNNSNPIVECPYCHSTDTKKISGMSKAGSVAMFGVFAMGKVSKQWHCNKCSSDF